MSEKNPQYGSSNFFAANLRRLRKNKGLTQEELGQALGVKKSCISNYEKSFSMPDVDRLLQIAAFFEITNLGQLVGYNPPSTLRDTDSDNRHVPVLRKIEYGVPPIYTDNIIDNFILPSITLKTGDFFGFIIPDNAMVRSSLKKGDLAIIRRQPIVSNGEIALVAIEKQPPLLRKAFVKKDIITLVPDSDDISYSSVTLDPSEDVFEIIGKVSYVHLSF